MMFNIKIEIEEKYGWIFLEEDGQEFYFKGHIYNMNKEELLKKLSELSKNEIEKFLKSIHGHYAFVFKTKSFLIMAVDKSRTIPLFYKIEDNNIKIVSSAISLESCNNKIDEKQLILFEMSGYTLSDKTIFKNIYVLKAGEFLFVKDKVQKNNYHRYEPWNIEYKSFENYLDELRNVTLKILRNVIESANGRQIIIPLSAGNDSRLVASGLNHLGYKNVICYSYGTQGNFESKIAEKISRKLGYKYIFIPLEHSKEKLFYKSEKYKEFLKFSDTFSSIPFIQSITTIEFLKEKCLIEKDAIFINGNSGDFISGGHILGKVKDNNTLLSEKERLNIIVMQIINKHYALWGDLRTNENIDLIRQSILKELKNEKISLSSQDIDHGVYEYIEFINRQSKYVITGQRVYEFYNYEWRLPLWDDDYLFFWEKVPKEYKIGQKLYKEMLRRSNWGNVWGDNIPVNKYDIVPKWIIPLRMIFKVIFALFGPLGRKKWHGFEISFFQYWMDVIHATDAVGYLKMIKAYPYKPRNVLSIIAREYIYKIKGK